MGFEKASLPLGRYYLLLCTWCLCKLVSSRALVARAGTSSVLTCPIREQLYMCPIGLGMFYTPYYMIFDTGSSATWVHSKYQPPGSSKLRSTHQYNPKNPKIVASSSHDGPETYSGAYIGGETVQGVVMTDTVKLGSVWVRNAHFAALTSQKLDETPAMDGLLGFGFTHRRGGNDLANHPSVWEALVERGYLIDNCFSVDASDPTTAMIGIGKSDPNRLNSPARANIDTSTGHWALPQVWFWAGNSNGEQIYLAGAGSVIIDTGADIYLPAMVVDTYWKHVDNPSDVRIVDGRYQVRCSAEPPDLVMQLQDNFIYTSRGDAEPNNGNSPVVTVKGTYLKIKWANSDATGWCFGGVQTAKGHISVLGGRLFKQLYAEFCVDLTSKGSKPYVSFSPHASPSTAFIVERTRNLPTLAGDTDDDAGSAVEQQRYQGDYYESNEFIDTDDDEPTYIGPDGDHWDPTTAEGEDDPVPTGVGQDSAAASSSSSSSTSFSTTLTSTSSASSSTSSASTSTSSSFSTTSSTMSSSSSSSTPTPDPSHSDNENDNNDADPLPAIDGITASSLGLSSSSSFSSSLFGSIAASITTAAIALGLGIGFNASHTNYTNIIPPGKLPVENSGPIYDLPNTDLRLITLHGSQVPNTTFSTLINAVQSDFNAGKGPSLTANYTATYQDLKLEYLMVPGREKDGLSAFNGTLGFLQWSRVDGLCNYFHFYVFYRNNECVPAMMLVGPANGTDDTLDRYRPADPQGAC